MWFLYSLTWVSTLIQFCFGLICVVSGVYYLAELVEEYSTLAKKVITWITLFILLCYGGLLFEAFPVQLLLCGVLNHIMHLLILQTFPYISLTSPVFAIALIILLVHHYLAFQFFGTTSHPFSEVMAYFTICLWMVPFILFVSLSANDYVLPTTNTNSFGVNDGDVVTKYFSRREKRYGLLTFFNYIESSILLKNKKSF